MKDAQRKILVKSPEPGNKAQRKVEYKNDDAITTGNYQRKLSAIISITRNYQGNYQLLYQSREKCEIYRDTAVSKKM